MSYFVFAFDWFCCLHAVNVDLDILRLAIKNYDGSVEFYQLKEKIVL